MTDRSIILAMREALSASLGVVYRAQRASVLMTSSSEEKLDGTIVTRTDKESEQAGLVHLRQLIVHAEESGLQDLKKGAIGIGEGRYSVLFDPLDGTRPFVNGAPTSTVIVGLYDKEINQVIGCMVGVPTNSLRWESFRDNSDLGQGVFAWSTVYIGGDIEIKKSPRRVWNGSLGPKSTVYLDLYPGFTRKGCKALSVEEQSRLFSTIHGTVSAVSMMGSNGLHHALVANGGEGVAGAITTAIGGPWDVAPVILVLMAGGAAEAFSRTEDGEWISRDPLDVYSYDFLVTGNSKETVEHLTQSLHRVCE